MIHTYGTNDADQIACMQAEVVRTRVQKLPQLRPLAEIQRSRNLPRMYYLCQTEQRNVYAVNFTSVNIKNPVRLWAHSFPSLDPFEFRILNPWKSSKKLSTLKRYPTKILAFCLKTILGGRQ